GSGHVKDGDERLRHRRMVGVRRHDVGHVGPPALHHGVVRQVVHAVVGPPPQHAEEDVRLGVEVDGIVLDARILQERHQLRPDGVVPAAVFRLHARVELHLEGVFLFSGHNEALRRRTTMGSAITRMSRRPVKIDMTMPGTLSSPRPKVTSPMTMAASTTPPTLPEPPRMLTPPSTVMVMISSSQPAAIEWRVEPRREVRHTAATPLMRPVMRKRTNLVRLTGMPENSAAKALLPMA